MIPMMNWMTEWLAGNGGSIAQAVQMCRDFQAVLVM